MRVIYLSLEQVLVIHTEQIDNFGGSHGLRDGALLESAIFRPQTTFGGEDMYPTVFKKAAVLMHSLVLNHAFIDENKRTGVVSGIIFLEINNYWLNVKQKALVECALLIANKKWNVEEIADWLKKNLKKVKLKNN